MKEDELKQFHKWKRLNLIQEVKSQIAQLLHVNQPNRLNKEPTKHFYAHKYHKYNINIRLKYTYI